MVYKPLWGLLKPVRRCPWCGGLNIQPSTHPLRLLRLLHCETWRCHQCWRRFPHRPAPASAEPMVSPAARRRRPVGKELRHLDAALAGLLAPAVRESGTVQRPEARERMAAGRPSSDTTS